MYDAITECNIPIATRKMNQIPRLISLIKELPYPSVIPTDNLPAISDKTAAMLQIKAQIKSMIEDSGVRVGNDITTYGDCIRAISVTNTFELDGPSEYEGKNFYITPYFNGRQVNATNWTVVSGSQYVTVNQYGRVDIATGTISQTVQISAQYTRYDTYTATITVLVSYDNQIVIQGADVMTGTSGNVVAVYNGNVVNPTWSITMGGEYATIDQSGNITITATGNIVVSVSYMGYTSTKAINVVYEANTTTETTVDENGTTTTTTTTTTTDPQTGATTTESSTTVTNDDGSQTQITTETTENQDGSSTSQSAVTNQNGSSSESTTNTSAPDPQTGAVTSNTNTTNYDENGDTTGSSTNTTTENTDGSSTSTTTNYNAEGDPTSGSNQEIDTEGNNSTQEIEYDENGNPEVSGYTIDTSENPDGEKNFDEDGVNTEFYGFDTTRGFVMHIHFTMNFTDQPPGQNENHHQVLTMKRSTPSPWYGFQLRQTGTNKYIVLGTQFKTGNNTNYTISPPRYIATNVAEYDIEVTYDPTLAANNFVARELISDTTIAQVTNIFPDLPELRYLTVCIGYGLDENGDPYRYSDISVSAFSITKLSLTVATPAISCDGQQVTITCTTPNTDIYYRLDGSGPYSQYTAPIAISANTLVEAYAELGSAISETASQTCIYIPPHNYANDYLAFRVTVSGTIAWQAFGTGYAKTIEYSVNGGTWTSITAVATTPATISVAANDVVRFRGTNSTYAGSKANYSGFEGGTATFNVEGNIMSLVYGDNFIGNTTLSGTYNFCSLFKNANVVSAENLVIPMTSLTNYCCRAMFSLCVSLTTPPVLPATTLAQGCYWYMFEGCAISTAPDLPATALVRECYGYMFTACASLSAVKCLATSGFGTTDCLTKWLNGVAAGGIFTKDDSATSWPTGVNGIPSGWTVVNV